MIAKFLKKADEGLTLVELMAAMIILTFGVVAALNILVESHKSNNFARAKTMAVNRAEEEMEWIFESAPADVVFFDNTWFAVGDLVGPGPGGEPGFIDVSAGEPHTVTITVNWQGRGTLPPGSVRISAFRSAINRT